MLIETIDLENLETLLPEFHATREAYLDAFVTLFRPRLTALGFTLPIGIRVSIGFPASGGLSRSRRVLGQCWDWEASKDGCHEIFVSPVVSDPVDILGVVVHELGHAAVGVKEKHGAAFKRYMKAVGLEGKATETTVGEELRSFIERNLASLGAYPGAGFDPFKVEGKKKDKPGSRLLKVECPGPECGYLVRTTKKCLLRGLPSCPCGLVMVGPEISNDGDVLAA